MKVALEELGVCEKKIVVSYEADEVGKKYADTVGMYKSAVTVPGFRRGKAPASMVEKRYGKQILEQLQEELEREGWNQFFQENKGLRIVSELGSVEKVPAKLDAKQGFMFSLGVAVAPEVKLPEYAGMELEAKKVEVGDDEVEKFIATLQEQAAEFADAPEGATAKEKDLVGIAYSATLDGKPLEEAVPAAAKMAKSDDYWAVASKEYSFVPGIGEALVGMKVGDEKDVDVAFGEKDVPVAELAGKQAIYHVKVNKLRTRTPAALDEAFFKRMGAKDEAGLKETVKAHLFNDKLGNEWVRRRNEAVAKLMEQVGMVDCSEHVLEREANRRLYQAVIQAARGGVSQDDIKAKRDEMAAACRETARKELARNYVLGAVAAKEGIRPSERAVEQQLAYEAQRAGAASVKEYAERVKVDEDALRDATRQEMRLEEAVTELLRKAKWIGDDAEAAAKAMSDEEPAEAAEAGAAEAAKAGEADAESEQKA